MSQDFRRLVPCAWLVGAAMALMPAGPAAQEPQAAFASQEAMQRAQEAYQAEMQRDAIARDKSSVVRQLMDRWWDHVGQTQKGREGFEAAFMGANPEKLLQLTQAKTWDAVVGTMLGLSSALGSPSIDLVFNPVTPCRVMDSRLGTGAYAGPYSNGQTISLYVTDPLTANGHNQGGASSCGIPFATGTAVALNITVVPSTGNGDLRMFPFGASAPNASIINFYQGLNLANATSAGIALANATNDLSIYVDYAAAVHIIVDVMGYYSASHATALDTVRVNSAATTLPNGFTYNPLDSPVCPAGYTLTGGGYNETAQASGLWVWQNGPGDGGPSASPTFWRFRGFNNTGGSTSLTVFGVCGRVPGR